jgi:hypothetical protein
MTERPDRLRPRSLALARTFSPRSLATPQLWALCKRHGQILFAGSQRLLAVGAEVLVLRLTLQGITADRGGLPDIRRLLAPRASNVGLVPDSTLHANLIFFHS